MFFYSNRANILKQLFFIPLELEWILGQEGAVPTELEEDPKPKVRDVLFSNLSNIIKKDDNDVNDW